jgi:peptidoglycan hydrolase CwlO-like protein
VTTLNIQDALELQREAEDLQQQLDDAKEKVTEYERESKSAQEALDEERTKITRLEKEIQEEKKRAQVKRI